MFMQPHAWAAYLLIWVIGSGIPRDLGRSFKFFFLMIRLIRGVLLASRFFFGQFVTDKEL
jgi:hypothetical protein